MVARLRGHDTIYLEFLPSLHATNITLGPQGRRRNTIPVISMQHCYMGPRVDNQLPDYAHAVENQETCVKGLELTFNSTGVVNGYSISGYRRREPLYLFKKPIWTLIK